MQEARWTPKAGCELPTRRAQIRGESPPQTKVTLKQLFDPPQAGGACRASEASAAGDWDPRWRCQRGGVQGVRPVSGRRLGPQVAVSEGGVCGGVG